MRRTAAVLLALSAAAAAAPAAHATEPMCATVWTEGDGHPNYTTGPTCVSWWYDYEYCEHDEAGVDNYEVHATWCIPQP